MDAVDIAVVGLDQQTPRLLAASSSAWPPGLRRRMQGLAAGESIDADSLAVLDAEIGAFVADAVSKLLQAGSVDPGKVSAIGWHGQTVAHLPDATYPTTLQIGDANVIAERTGITTVNDFRRRDMAAGGQGAPLAPAFHAAILRDESEDRAVLNLGGIANITVLPADRGLPVIGFDTGPANCLMDAWIRQHHDKPFDQEGVWAASAAANDRLLEFMMDDPFFAQQPPKSTGTQHFSIHWLNRKLTGFEQASPAAVQATLLALTCQTVADAISRHAPNTARVLVCGGGVHNRHLMKELGRYLGLPVESTAGFGVDPKWMEAMAFAWLAQRALNSAAGNLPSVTGAKGPRILGAIHPA